MPEQAFNPAAAALLPKSVLWCGGNIAAAVIFTTVIVRFIGVFILNGLFNIYGGVGALSVLNLTYARSALVVEPVLTLVGVALGSWFGVRYITKRARIDPQKITRVAIVAATIPLAFFLLFVVLDLVGGSVINEASQFPVASFIVNLLVAPIIFFVVKRSLKNRGAYTTPTTS